ncbi:MAG: type II toxin-antitoxin system RelE/ParE family toxin [Clostridia bacterium]|nr:type II toxin-antitoxin system RelE/ParE family toxin [Clostridia bacterium]
MTRAFVELPLFSSKWKGLGLTDDDLRRLQEELLADPKVGAVMRKTGGIRKMRFAFEQRGKSGSVRVIYVDFEIYEKIYLLTAYAKNEKENLSDEECNELRQLIKVLEDQLSENAQKGEKK